MGKFRKTNPKDFAKWHWDASELMFDCKCGNINIYLDADEPNFICRCGKEYRLIYDLLIKE